MGGRVPVLSPLNGSLCPAILFVAEAPGRRGADRTRIPMCGDASGAAFRQLLAETNIAASEVFVTNAVLCNPRDAQGRNRPPSAHEIRRCSSFLARTLELLDPPVVATLGAAALKALSLIEPHGLALNQAVGRVFPWNGRLLVPLYHPSPRVINMHRSLSRQRSDWEALRHALGAAGFSLLGPSPSRGGRSERSFIPK